MPEITKQFYHSDRLTPANLSESRTLGRITEILYYKGNKPTLITEEKVGRYQYKLIKTIGAILASFSNKHIGFIESLLMNCDDAITQDTNYIEFTFSEHSYIPYKKLIVTSQEVVALAQIMENIIHRTEEKHPDLKMEHRGEKIQDVELVLW